MTSLFNGERKPKDEPHFHALGNIDELNAHLGVCREYCSVAGLDSLVERILEIQSRLFDLGAHVATPRSSSASSAARMDRTSIDEGLVTSLEKWIDEMDKQLPPLRNFILPGGGMASAQLHVARAVTRRAERSIIPLVHTEDVSDVALKFLNRLSDFFFVAARFASSKESRPETVWKKARAPRESEVS